MDKMAAGRMYYWHLNLDYQYLPGPAPGKCQLKPPKSQNTPLSTYAILFTKYEKIESFENFTGAWAGELLISIYYLGHFFTTSKPQIFYGSQFLV